MTLLLSVCVCVFVCVLACARVFVFRINLCITQYVSGVGSPMPGMKWTKDGKGIGETVDTDQTPEFCRIKLKSPTRADKGNYELELTNSEGKDTVPISINVVGKIIGTVSLSSVLTAR